MVILRQVLLGGLLPALATFAVLTAATRPWRPDARDDHEQRAKWAGPVAFGLAYAVGYVALLGWPRFAAPGVAPWIFYLGLLAVGVGLAETYWKGTTRFRWIWRALLGEGVLLVVLQPMIANAWMPGQAAFWLGALLAMICATWALLEAVAVRVRGAPPALTFAVMSTGAAAIFALARTPALTQLAGILVAYAVGAVIVASLKPGMTMGRGALVVFMVLFSALWVAGAFYADVPPYSAILLPLAPLFAWLGYFGQLRRRRNWSACLLRAALVAMPVAVAVVIAALHFQPAAMAHV